MFLTKEEAIKSGASEEFVNAKTCRCDTCANGEMKIISDTEYICKCRLGRTKANQCMSFEKSHYVERQDMRKEDGGKWQK